jgi:hypothetical protein
MKANHQNTSNDLDNEEAALHEFDFLSGDAATTGRMIKKRIFNLFFVLNFDIRYNEWRMGC